jgi:DNA-binding NarL/FixJ family response regulator
VGVAKVLSDEDVRVVADAADAPTALGAVRAYGPDLLVIGGHEGNQADVTRQALTAVPDLQCIVLVPTGEERDLRLVLLAGARAVVPRAVAPEELRDAVRRVEAGDHVVSPSLLTRMFEGNGTENVAKANGTAPAAGPVLTGREREIVRLLGAGRSNAEIASALFVTSATVKTHLAHIYEKLGVRTRYDALGRAVALGLLD